MALLSLIEAQNFVHPQQLGDFQNETEPGLFVVAILPALDLLRRYFQGFSERRLANPTRNAGLYESPRKVRQFLEDDGCKALP